MGVQTDRRERIGLVGAIAGSSVFRFVLPRSLGVRSAPFGGGTARVLALVGQMERTWAIERAARVRAVAAGKGKESSGPA